MDLALNNLQRLICHKTQATKQTKLKSHPKNIEKDGFLCIILARKESFTKDIFLLHVAKCCTNET